MQENDEQKQKKKNKKNVTNALEIHLATFLIR